MIGKCKASRKEFYWLVADVRCSGIGREREIRKTPPAGDRMWVYVAGANTSFIHWDISLLAVSRE